MELWFVTFIAKRHLKAADQYHYSLYSFCVRFLSLSVHKINTGRARTGIKWVTDPRELWSNFLCSKYASSLLAKLNMVFESTQTRDYNAGQNSLGHLCPCKNYLCFKTEFEKALFLNSLLLLPPPLPYHIKCRKSGKIECTHAQHVYRGGREWASVVEFARDCLFDAFEKAPQVQICPKTFVHDCS